MFYDERINLECGKIYRRGIGYATMVAGVYGAFRAVYLQRIGHLHAEYLLTELSIAICGIIILLIGAARFGWSRDERSVYEKHQYYLGAAKVFLITGLAGYAVTIPLSWSKPFSDFPMNYLIIFLEVLGAIYLFYAFKTREINFNYSVIAEEKKVYYSHVFANMGKLSGILFIVFLFASTLGMALHQSLLEFVSLWLAYLWSCVGLSLEYLFISWVEKRSYDEEEPKGLRTATVIAVVAMLMSQFLVAIFNVWYIYIATGNLQEYTNVGEFLARLNYAKLYLGYYFSVLSSLALSHFLTQIRRSKKVSGTIRGMIIMNVVSLLISLCQRLIFQVADEAFIRIYAEHANYLTMGMLVINLILLCRMIKGVIDEFHATKLLWALPVVRIMTSLLKLFFLSYSQSLLVAATVVEELAYLVFAVWGLLVLRKVEYWTKDEMCTEED